MVVLALPAGAAAAVKVGIEGRDFITRRGSVRPHYRCWPTRNGTSRSAGLT